MSDLIEVAAEVSVSVAGLSFLLYEIERLACWFLDMPERATTRPRALGAACGLVAIGFASSVVWR
jgi:hypothetical protein